MQKRYYVISAKDKTIHTEASDLKEEVRSEWFDIASDRFSRLAFWDKAKEVFYVEIYDFDRFELISDDLLKEIERISEWKELPFIRTVRNANTVGGCDIYACIFGKTDKGRIYLFDKDQPLFIIGKSICGWGEADKKEAVYIVPQPFLEPIGLGQDVMIYDFGEFCRYHSIIQGDNFTEIIGKILNKCYVDGCGRPPIPNTLFRCEAAIKPFLKLRTENGVFDKSLICHSEKYFRTTFIHVGEKEES